MKKNQAKKVMYGWKHEAMDVKIKEALSLSLAERHRFGLAIGSIATLLERNQRALYGRGLFKTVQVLKRKKG